MQTFVRKLRNQGGSLVVSIPRELAFYAGLAERSHVTLNVTDLGVIAIRKLEHPNVIPPIPEQRA